MFVLNGLGHLYRGLLVAQIPSLRHVGQQQMVSHQKRDDLKGLPGHAESLQYPEDDLAPFLRMITLIPFGDIMQKSSQK